MNTERSSSMDILRAFSSVPISMGNFGVGAKMESMNARLAIAREASHLGIHNASIDTLRYAPDLSEILDAMHNERGTLLQPTLESIQQSFAQRRAVALMDDDRPVGFVRFSILLDATGKEKLCLPEDFPNIFESGSAIILQEYRGRRLYPGLRSSLLQMYQAEMQRKELLVLGTTKSPKVVESLDDSNSFGLNFTIIHHDELPMIAPFTCVCEGDFGNGFQNEGACPKKATPQELVLIQKVDWKALQEGGSSSNGKIPCTLYISDLDLAHSMEQRLLERFGSQEAVIDALKSVGHYD